MWKKTFIIAVCLLSSLSVAYVYCRDYFDNMLSANSVPVFQLPKGAKVVLGKYNNKEIVWDIGNNDNNGSYVLMSSKPIADKIATFDSNLPLANDKVPPIQDRDKYCFHYANQVIMYCPVTPLKNEIN